MHFGRRTRTDAEERGEVHVRLAALVTGHRREDGHATRVNEVPYRPVELLLWLVGVVVVLALMLTWGRHATARAP
jgi:hypothetical protein